MSEITTTAATTSTNDSNTNPPVDQTPTNVTSPPPPPQTAFLLDHDPNLRGFLGSNLDELNSHESFAFKLGLELALTSYTTPEHLGQSSYDSLKSLNHHLTGDLKIKKCEACDFQTESELALDEHKSEPHTKLGNDGSRFIVCLFCDEFKTRSHEQYRSHVELEHKRMCHLETAPFVNDAFMCNVCDFEATGDEYTAIDRIERHIDSICPFREEVLQPRASVLRYTPQLDMKLVFSFVYLRGLD